MVKGTQPKQIGTAALVETNVLPDDRDNIVSGLDFLDQLIRDRATGSCIAHTLLFDGLVPFSCSCSQGSAAFSRYGSRCMI